LISKLKEVLEISTYCYQRSKSVIVKLKVLVLESYAIS